MQTNASETATLRDLLADFGIEGWTPDRAEEAFEEVNARSRALADSYVSAADAVDTVLGRSPVALPMLCRALLVGSHARLFVGILSNAGAFRLPGDAGGSNVFFGGMRDQGRRTRFTGTGASRISEELTAAFERLTDRRGEGLAGREAARDAAVLFYADLSRIHPFYDANGRTGRFVISVYLHLHGWLVEWGRIESAEAKFLRKINNLNEKATGQTDYRGLLLKYWRDRVVDTADLL